MIAMTTNLEKIKDKIVALLKKTKENGASEFEANSAMDHAQKMMKEYGITMDDIKKNSAISKEFNKVHVNADSSYMHPVDSLVSLAITEYTDTMAWIDKAEKSKSKVIFFGYSVDVELAIYIREVCKSAMDFEWNMYKAKLSVGNRADQRKSFMAGMGIRLAQRLRKLKENDTKTTGTDLVVLKTEMVRNEFQNMNMKMQKGKSYSYDANNAFSAGAQAAENVQFSRKMAGSEKNLLT
jgi:hypothetical protein